MEQSNIPGAKMKHNRLLLFGTLLIVSFAIMGNIRATTYECDSCALCSDMLANGCYNPGDIILLNQSITATTDCINVEWCENDYTFDCQGFTIEGSYEIGEGYSGLVISNSAYSFIQNCIIKGFDIPLTIYYSSYTEIRNMTISDYDNAVIFDSTLLNIFHDNTIKGNGTISPILYFNSAEQGLFYNNTFNVSGLGSWIGCSGSCNNSWNNTYGNYWFLENGTGFSQICINDNNDSFCDFQYEIDSNNIDYKPLTMNFTYEIPGPPESIGLTINQPQNISYYEGNLAYNATTNITANSICLSMDGNLTYPICSYNVSMLYGTINMTPGFYNWTFRANNSNTAYDTVFFTINETPEEETPGPISNETIIFQIDSNLDSTITKYLCSDNNTLKIESNIQYCVSGSGNFTPNCYYINKTKYQNCAYGCYPGVVENGDYCSPPDYMLWGFGLIVFFVAIFLINRYYRGR